MNPDHPTLNDYLKNKPDGYHDWSHEKQSRWMQQQVEKVDQELAQHQRQRALTEEPPRSPFDPRCSLPNKSMARFKVMCVILKQKTWTISRMAEAADISYEGARGILDQLADAGILGQFEQNGTKKYDVWNVALWAIARDIQRSYRLSRAADGRDELSRITGGWDDQWIDDTVTSPRMEIENSYDDEEMTTYLNQLRNMYDVEYVSFSAIFERCPAPSPTEENWR